MSAGLGTHNPTQNPNLGLCGFCVEYLNPVGYIGVYYIYYYNTQGKILQKYWSKPLMPRMYLGLGHDFAWVVKPGF